MALLLVTHDLGLVAETCDRVAVMYAGRIVETGSVERVFEDAGAPVYEGPHDGPARVGSEEEKAVSD